MAQASSSTLRGDYALFYFKIPFMRLPSEIQNTKMLCNSVE